MYSILILNDKGSYDYSKDDAGADWKGTLAEAKSKLVALMNTYTATRLVVVHNTTVDMSGITIADVE